MNYGGLRPLKTSLEFSCIIGLAEYGFSVLCCLNGCSCRIIKRANWILNSFPFTSVFIKPRKEIAENIVDCRDYEFQIANLPIFVAIANIFCRSTIFNTFQIGFSFFIIQSTNKSRTKYCSVTCIVNEIWGNCFCGYVYFQELTFCYVLKNLGSKVDSFDKKIICHESGRSLSIAYGI